jgi:hypothetical protein
LLLLIEIALSRFASPTRIEEHLHGVHLRSEAGLLNVFTDLLEKIVIH